MTRSYAKGTKAGDQIWLRGYHSFLEGIQVCGSMDPSYRATWMQGYEAAEKKAKLYGVKRPTGRPPTGRKVGRGTDFYKLPSGKVLEKRLEMVVEMAKAKEANGEVEVREDPLHEARGLFKHGRVHGRRF